VIVNAINLDTMGAVFVLLHGNNVTCTWKECTKCRKRVRLNRGISNTTKKKRHGILKVHQKKS
jgi:hypothetical protein